MLVRNAEALERLAKVDTLVVDKTGTLTEGKPTLTGVEAADGFDEDDVLRLAASLEARQRASARRGDRARRRGARLELPRSVASFDVADRQGRHGTRRWPRVRARQSRA